MSKTKLVKDECTKVTLWLRTEDVEKARRIADQSLGVRYQHVIRDAVTQGLRVKQGTIR
jgi:hypothetical protein